MVRVIGRTYLERGQPVTLLIRWGPGGGPRNVLIRRADGTLIVRPFRGLRRRGPHTDAPSAPGVLPQDGETGPVVPRGRAGDSEAAQTISGGA